MTVLVTLDLFSGRPNPHWTLDPAQEAEFGRLLDAMVPGPAKPGGDQLGYRGFHVTIDRPPAPAQSLVVYDGGVNGRGETRTDAGRTLERWLLGSAHGKLETAIEAYVASEIGDR